MCQEKKGGRRLASIEDCVDASIEIFEDYIKKNKERLITAAKYNNGNVSTSRKKKTITRKQKWEEKQLYGYFKRQSG